MPSSHLPRTPCDKSVYDFSMRCFGHRRWLRAMAYMCSHYFTGIVRFLLRGLGGNPGGKSVQRLCGDCTEIVQCHVQLPCSLRILLHGNRTEPVQGSGLRTVPAQGLCNATYDMSTGYGLTIFFKFVKLLAKPNRRGRGARESVWNSHSRLLPPQGGLAGGRTERGDTGSVDPSQSQMWTRHKWWTHILAHLNLCEKLFKFNRK